MAKKVLIVEDYADTRSFMKFLIESYGYQALEAADGQEAVESVRRQNPDLVLYGFSDAHYGRIGGDASHQRF